MNFGTDKRSTENMIPLHRNHLTVVVALEQFVATFLSRSPTATAHKRYKTNKYTSVMCTRGKRVSERCVVIRDKFKGFALLCSLSLSVQQFIDYLVIKHFLFSYLPLFLFATRTCCAYTRT